MNPHPLVTITVQARSIRAGDRLVAADGFVQGLAAVHGVDYGPDLNEVVLRVQAYGAPPVTVVKLRASDTVVLAHSYFDHNGNVWTVNRCASAVVAQWQLTRPAPEAP
jgi:hypothetical protein